MNQYLLGVDIGTTGTKSILFTASGEIVGQAYQGYPTAHPQLGYSEQNPQDWWDAVCQTVRTVCSDPKVGENVAGIFLSTQGGTMVCMDDSYTPLHPAIVWNDNRCTEEYQEFLQQARVPDLVYRKTGWKLDASASCLHPHWFQKNKPDIWERAKIYMSVPDYISYKMTGIPAIDMSNAGINRFFNIKEAMYDDTLMDFGGMTQRQFPKVVPSGQVIGHLTNVAAKELGLTTKTVLVSGAHDQYAVALGAGACKAGDIIIGSETCWVITCIGDAPDFASGLSQSVAAIPGKWGSLWFLSSGGVCLEWWRNHLTIDSDGTQIPFSVINEEVSKCKAAEDGLFIFPFSGYAGLDEKFTKATFVGLDLSHNRFHMAWAIMEGIAFQIVWMLDAFGAKPSSDGLILAGGASKSEVWCQMVANIANLPVRIPETADLACVGAAIMAGVGSGVYKNEEDGYRRLSIPQHIIYPEPDRASVYRDLVKNTNTKQRY